MQKLGSLTRPTQFRAVLREGTRFRAPGIALAVSPGTQGIRLGLSVHARGAVERNRMKRRLREAFREVGRSSGGGADVVIRADAGVATASYQDLVNIASDALTRGASL